MVMRSIVATLPRLCRFRLANDSLRLHVAVRGGALGDLALALDRRGDGLEDLAEPLQPEPLARLLEELELQLGGELEPRADREGRLLDVRGRRLDVGARQLDEAPEERKRLLDVLWRRRIVPVDDGLDRPRLEAAPWVSSTSLKRSPPSTTMLSRPSSNRSVTSTTRRERPDLADARRRRRRRARTAAPRRGTRRSARGSAARRCGAGPARSGAGRARAERGRSRPSASLEPPGQHPAGALLQDEDGDGREETEDGDEPHVSTLGRLRQETLSGSSGNRQERRAALRPASRGTSCATTTSASTRRRAPARTARQARGASGGWTNEAERAFGISASPCSRARNDERTSNRSRVIARDQRATRPTGSDREQLGTIRSAADDASEDDDVRRLHVSGSRRGRRARTTSGRRRRQRRARRRGLRRPADAATCRRRGEEFDLYLADPAADLGDEALHHDRRTAVSAVVDRNTSVSPVISFLSVCPSDALPRDTRRSCGGRLHAEDDDPLKRASTRMARLCRSRATAKPAPSEGVPSP